jgi:hypothetical protein
MPIFRRATAPVSAFDRAPGTQTPDYQVGMRYWENGVADDMQMNFGDFSVNAKLTEYSPQPHRC